MELIVSLFEQLTDVEHLVRTGGLVALAIIVFAETGLMIGFFLPGDSLLITAGLYSQKGFFDFVTLNLLLITMAIVGDAVGFATGRFIGPAIFRREGRFIRREHLVRTQLFYERHGGKTIILSRFIPILRTFAPVVAGVAGMEYRRFAFFNVTGAIGWVVSMTATGWLLGMLMPGIAESIEGVILLVIGLSLLPVAVHHLVEVRQRRRERDDLRLSLHEIVHMLRAIPIEWSENGVLQFARSLSATRNATTLLRDERAAFEVRVSDEPMQLEIVAAASAPLGSMTDAAREMLGWEYDRRLETASRDLTAILGCQQQTSDDGDLCWVVPEGELRILWHDDAASDTRRLVLVLRRPQLHRGAA